MTRPHDGEENVQAATTTTQISYNAEEQTGGTDYGGCRFRFGAGRFAGLASKAASCDGLQDGQRWFPTPTTRISAQTPREPKCRFDCVVKGQDRQSSCFDDEREQQAVLDPRQATFLLDSPCQPRQTELPIGSVHANLLHGAHLGGRRSDASNSSRRPARLLHARRADQLVDHLKVLLGADVNARRNTETNDEQQRRTLPWAAPDGISFEPGVPGPAAAGMVRACIGERYTSKRPWMCRLEPASEAAKFHRIKRTTSRKEEWNQL